MSQTSSVLLPPGGQRILVIMAHPDDAESYCGGTIARLTAEGCEVHYLLATRGDRGSDEADMTPERLSLIREQEQRRAAAVLGVQKVVFLDNYFDGQLAEATATLRRDLTLAIRTVQPEVVFAFDPWKRYELHPDHRTVGLCSFDAIAAARGRMNYAEQVHDGVTAHHVKQVYFFNTDQPNHWVDISQIFAKKVDARCCHVSQINPANHPSGYLRRWASETGAAKGYSLAEAFHYYGL